MTEQTNPYADWIGSKERLEDQIWLGQVVGTAAMLDDTGSQFKLGGQLPPLWHWMYFLPRAPWSKISTDGHPERGGFMPPIALPRRMFAGSRMTFNKLLTIGEPAVRHGEVLKISEKSGGSGKLAFVTVSYKIEQNGEICIEEEQDIVYREPGAPVPAPEPVPFPEVPAGSWTKTITPDPVLLFRFSALTFNAHRIHIDRRYAMEEEGYPGLIVHGPLTAIQLAELIRHNQERPIAKFTFRGQAPLFDLGPYRVVATQGEDNKVELSAQGPNGKTTMVASAELG
uniref:Mesaconyl-C4-CoA hydratase n=1 Tax=Candidatus Kentrum eta TaxID=2126337 RepID=A0A450VGA8_9GAMM|nr:MAG: mesaconyl-C4-CoA hydratase [Candidatus Kentron sp. H]VFK03751.1 MAG: mesaconyl-C4-CoA hydratase [Candidatus Kentron sp. H]VFK06637.1 MAG: mesaconyl-C4-CoA hydratase [Candidatus Kentron sp. H]